jgi:hypothetical protein
VVRAVSVGTAVVAGIVSAAAIGAAQTLAECSPGQVRLMTPQTQGTATQAVAFVAIRNSGSACSFTAPVSLTVVDDGARVRAIDPNPISAVLKGALPHGVVALLDVWWSNWCGTRGVFDARATFASQVRAGPYRVLPECISHVSSSRLRPVVYPLKPPPVTSQ